MMRELPTTENHGTVPDVAEQHMEAATHLHGARETLRSAPHVTLRRLGRVDDRLAAYLDGLQAVHDGEHYRGQYANYGIADKPEYPRAEHPVVRTHPVTGRKALYVNKGFTRRLLGIPLDESDGILNYLYEHMANPLFQCRFRWQENSIAFWDNRCVQHHAMWDYWPHTRSGHRVTVKGDRPV